LELNIIYNEDCLETMKAIPNNFIDLTVTSPPYDSLRVYNGYSFNFPQVAKSLYEITKPGGVLVWIVGDATKG
jgi:DNA modification methylase